MSIKIRRRLFLAGGLAAAAGSFFWHRGIRYPTLSLEAPELSRETTLNAVRLELNDCFLLYETTNQFRAFAPEPSITLQSDTQQSLQFSLNNVSPDAVLHTNVDGVREERDGITRHISMSIANDVEAKLAWRVPFASNYRFASIGDTGGNHELAWCIKRAADLGAQFFLHLGDFNYQEGDYERAIELFHNAPIPCFISIGNHDFHDAGLLHHQFTDSLGPFNHSFTLGGLRFVNLDTAANVWPRSGGKRGKLVKRLLADNALQPTTIAYTHRPLHDPTGVSTHDIGSVSERDWLINALKDLNARTLLSGHIHIFDRTEFAGIDNIIVGQGLGHQDLLTNDNSTSKLAIGSVNQNGLESITFEPLSMPFDLHCHPRIEPVKESLRDGEHAELIKSVDAACVESNI